jgi:oligopeptide/dipeptide ABC transporter ATP-binding protein
MALIDVKNLRLEFRADERSVCALDDVSLRIDAGETVCLVGESGSGKSVLALSLVRLLAEPPAVYPSGSINVDGRDVLKLAPSSLRELRGRVVSYVFQDPGAALNPVMRIGGQIAEALPGRPSRREADAEVIRLMKLVGIPSPETRARDYPHQLSGGMQQRVMIAMAVASRPRLLVADEPTTALDVTIQAQIFDLLRELKQSMRMAILLITHNLGLVREMADRVAVMYAGQIVESAPVAALLAKPLHPYTRALMDSVPELGADASSLRAIPGVAPQLGRWPTGCRFHPRCPLVVDDCRSRMPALIDVGPARAVRCPVVSPPT